MYDSPAGEELREGFRDSLKDLRTISATKDAAERSLSEKAGQLFTFPPITSQPPAMRTIQFYVTPEQLERAKKCLGRSGMYNYEVGERIFKYFMDRECQ
jgi:hypothetical protein